MNVQSYLEVSTENLSNAGIGTARLDCLVLLEDCLGKDRANLLAHPELELTDEQINTLNEQIKRRLTHEPLAYIRGRTEFYGRDFMVDKDVLEPRPESEMMIDLLKKLAQDTEKSDMTVADIGSGSGCLGITAALELGLKSADFYDIDPATFEVAKQNAKTHGIIGKFYESDLLTGKPGPYGIILANLPYVPDSFHVNQAAMREPRLALYGGSDGLDLYRRLFKQLEDFDWKPEYILTEALPLQHEQLAGIAAKHGFIVITHDDFIQVFSPAD